MEEGKSSDNGGEPLRKFEPEQEGLEQEELDEDSFADDEGSLSLEELSQSYAKVLADHQPTTRPENDSDGEDEVGLQIYDSSEEDTVQATPLSIVESILFVGRADGGGIPASEIAALMRGVSSEEVAELVGELNTIYAESGSALRVAEAADGYKTTLADAFEPVRERFYGRVKEITLTQAAIDCLALVAYQPGVSRQKLEDQRGQPSGGILNQLVRRGLLDVRREGTGKSRSAHYYPTAKLGELAGLESLEDLPQVEDFE